MAIHRIARVNLNFQLFPLTLLLAGDGRIGMAPRGVFKSTVDFFMNGGPDAGAPVAVFSNDHFLICENDAEEFYEYGILYPRDSCPLLCKWVKAQNIPNPFV